VAESVGERESGRVLEMKPTDEQLSAIELFADQRNLKINAFAGTGKTATLRMIAEYASGRRGLYLAFNRAIAE
jgi:hypothetical protein